ncbi:SIR2 family NAD-dependent protein deacylase [Spirosoma pollinicola]|nr:SIR2 family protein [Spirosoma pollinicola]
MVNQLKDDIGIENEDTEDPLQVAQIYFNEKKHKEYIQKIRHILHHKKKKYNQINEAIFDLQPEHIITTNFDDLLEQVVRNRALPFSIIKKDSEFPYASNSNLLVKIHGDLDNDDFTLKEEDYLDYDVKHPLFDAFIKSIFSTKLVLFVGYSYSDIDLKIILQKVRNILGKDFQSSYLLAPEYFSEYKINYLKEKGVNVISYEPNKEVVEKFLKGENANSISFKREGTNLLDKGIELLDLITFINQYDRFIEGLAKKDYFEQMYLSLKRFSELNSLPYFFIANVYPFNNTDKQTYYNEHETYSLKVNNSELVNFLYNNTIYNNGNTKITDEYIKQLNNINYAKEINKFSEFIIKILNYSAISILHSKETVNEYGTIERNDIVLLNSIEKFCECPNCLINNLKFDKLINFIQTGEITDATDIKEDSLLAFSHYKMSNYFQAFNMFEDIAQKAWHMEKYIIYFIAKSNLIKLGHNMGLYEYNNIEAKLTTELEAKASLIDLEAVYRQINDVSKEESELLKIIRDDEVLRRSVNNVYDEYEKIKDLFESIKKGTSYNTHDSSKIIDFHLGSVEMFYERNCIVSDIFSEYRNLFNTGVEALLLNHKIYQKYSRGGQTLNLSFCTYFINYGNFKKLQKVLRNYEIKNIDLDEDAKIKLPKIINNYLKSLYSENNIFGRDVEANQKFTYQIQKAGVHKSKFTDIFDNICLLLRIVDINEVEIEFIGNQFIDFINATETLYWYNINCLVFFIEGNKNNLSLDFYHNFLSALCRKPKLITEEIFKSMAGIFSTRTNEKKINEVNLIEKIILNQEGLNSGVRSKTNKYLFYLWYLVDDNIKPLIIDKITHQLNQDFSDSLYWDYSINNIIDYKEHFPNYINFIKNNTTPFDSFNDIYTLLSEQAQKREIINYNFLNLIRLVYSLNITITDEIYESKFISEDYMKFYLSPEKYNYNNFNPNWLNYMHDSYIHKKLKEIPQVVESLTTHIKAGNANKELINLYIKFYLQ